MKIPNWPIYIGPNKNIDLKQIKYILSKINNPHLNLKNIIHITGTKGKGSTALFISNILKESGYKVNTYISPHIYECNERILLNGIKVSDNELQEAIELIRLTYETEKINDPTMFEALTCSALHIMSQHKADFNVIEVGMGGRYDATNVFDNNPPIACVFTPIHLDHTNFLGKTIKDITIQKSFLIKQGVLNVILSSQSIEAKTILKKITEKKHIKNIFCYKDDYEVFYKKNSPYPVYESKILDACFPFQKPNMSGDYQLINASCAITTCIACLKSTNNINSLTHESINTGMKKTLNIVRMERIKNGTLFSQLPNGSIFYIDGAHNQLAAHALASWIIKFKKKNKNKYKIILAIARTKGTNNNDFVKEFLDKNNKPIIDMLIATRANLESIPESPEIIAKTAKKYGFYCKIAYCATEIINHTLYYKNNKILLICTGSLYIARDITKANNS